MEHERVGPTLGQKLSIQLKRPEGLPPLRFFGFLSHRRPNIRIQNIGALRSHLRIVDNFEMTAGPFRELSSPQEKLRVRIVSVGASQNEVKAHEAGEKQP